MSGQGGDGGSKETPHRISTHEHNRTPTLDPHPLPRHLSRLHLPHPIPTPHQTLKYVLAPQEIHPLDALVNLPLVPPTSLMKRGRQLQPQSIIDLLIEPVLPGDGHVQLLEHLHQHVVHRHAVHVPLYDVDVPWQPGVV